MTPSLNYLRASVACDFLWAVCSAWEYFLGDIVPNAESLPRDWEGLHSDLARWAVDQSIQIRRSAQPHKRLDQSREFGNLQNSVVYKWGADAQNIARQAHKDEPTLSESLWIFVCYCRWFRDILSEFQLFVQAEDLAASPFQASYFRMEPKIARLLASLQAECVHLIVSLANSGAGIGRIEKAIDVKGQELAAHWHHAVEAALGLESAG